RVRVAPNPFGQITNFEIELSQRGEYQFQVFDLNGKEVKNERLLLKEGINRFSFDGSALPKGFYSYRLFNDRGFLSGKIIKTR
ncbi:MAG: T9SS type A sorting domain-containing protein, partial [Bacteroidota bacterium]